MPRVSANPRTTSVLAVVITMMLVTLQQQRCYCANAAAAKMLAPVGVPAISPMGVPIMSPMGPELAPAPMGDCTTALLGMSDCLGYVQAGSNETKPEPACCPELSSLMENQPKCLCLLLGDTAASFGIQIDLSKALQLPSACSLPTPSLSMCPAAPGSAPPSSEAPGAMSPGVAASSPAGSINGGSSAPSVASSSTIIMFVVGLVLITSSIPLI